MAKVIPVIDGVEALLMLLNEPEKVSKYLNEIKGYRDEIKSMIGVDMTLTRSRQIEQEAVTLRAKAQQDTADMRASAVKMQESAKYETEFARSEAQECTNKANQLAKQVADEKAKFEAWRVAVETDIASRQSALNERQQQVAAREEKVSALDHALKVRQAKFEAALS